MRLQAPAYSLGLLLVLLAGLPPSTAWALDRSCRAQNEFALAVHGGAVWGQVSHDQKERFIKDVLVDARARLAAGDKALDVVEAAIVAMEDSALFNAGQGSVANRAGEIEMDASIMSGRSLRAGAVASVRRLKNPIAAARLIMDKTRHVLLVGPSADDLLPTLGAEAADPADFLYASQNVSDVLLPDDITVEAAPPEIESPWNMLNGAWAGTLSGRLNHALVVERLTVEGATAVVAFGMNESAGVPEPSTHRLEAQLKNGFLTVANDGFHLSYRLNGGALEAQASFVDGARLSGTLQRRDDLIQRGGTVGAVALDRCGDLAAGTSTGGFGSKMPGRVGDSPIIGAGTYADNRTAAISATGHGEFFIRHAVAHEVAARIRHGGQPLVEAAEAVVLEELVEAGGEGGIIAVDASGQIAMSFNTSGMVRGFVTDGHSPVVGTYSID